MYKLIVSLPANRDFEGSVRLEDEKGQLVTGPFAVCGCADRNAAMRHGNPSCNPRLLFGDTPLGRYRVAGILPTGRKTDLPADRFGPHSVVVLNPMLGEAALADANGRFHILMQGGKLARGRRLRPTNGSLRLADNDQKTLVGALRKRHPCVCDCVAITGLAAVRAVACDSSYDEADPPLRGALGSLLGITASFGSRRDKRFLPESGQIRHFGPPSFHLFADSGGDGGAGAGGYEPSEGPISISYVSSIDPVQQATPQQCWVAAASMALDQSFDSSLWAAADGSLPAANVPEFARANGLQLYNPQTWTVQGLSHLLQSGPLMVLGNTPDGHAYVIGAMTGDGTAAGTLLTIYDPAKPVKEQPEKWSYEFLMQQYPLATDYVLQNPLYKYKKGPLWLK